METKKQTLSKAITRVANVSERNGTDYLLHMLTDASPEHHKRGCLVCRFVRLCKARNRRARILTKR